MGQINKSVQATCSPDAIVGWPGNPKTRACAGTIEKLNNEDECLRELATMQCFIGLVDACIFWPS